MVTFGGTVRDELESGTKVLVVLSDPFQEGTLGDDVHLLAGGGIKEFVLVEGLLLLGVVEDVLLARAILEDPSADLEVFEDNKGFDGTKLEGLESIFNTVANLAGILANLVKVLSNQLLLLDELDVAEGFGRQLDSLVETVITTVGHINDLDDFGLQTGIEHVGGVEIVLEIGGTGEDETSNVNLVVGDEVLDGDFGNLSDIVVTFLITQTRETQGRLTTTAVLLGQINGELVNDFAGVAAERAKKRAVTVHDDESKFLVRVEKFCKSLGVELVVAEVERGVDGLEGLKVNIDLLLLAFLGQDFTTVDDKAIRGHLVVELESALGGGNGRQDGLSVDSGLDVGSGTLQAQVSDRSLAWWSTGLRGMEELAVRILQPTSWQFEKPDPWGLRTV